MGAVNVYDAKTHFSRLLRRVRAGEEMSLPPPDAPSPGWFPSDRTVGRGCSAGTKARCGSRRTSMRRSPTPSWPLSMAPERTRRTRGLDPGVAYGRARGPAGADEGAARHPGLDLDAS